MCIMLSHKYKCVLSSDHSDKYVNYTLCSYHARTQHLNKVNQFKQFYFCVYSCRFIFMYLF